MQFEVRAQFFNVFNRTQVSDPTGTNFAAKPTIVNGQYRGGFGYINTGSLAQLPRYGQIVARITW
jgi:hypothetical protein